MRLSFMLCNVWTLKETCNYIVSSASNFFLIMYKNDLPCKRSLFKILQDFSFLFAVDKNLKEIELYKQNILFKNNKKKQKKQDMIII